MKMKPLMAALGLAAFTMTTGAMALEAVPDTKAEHRKERHERMFTKVDADKDGAISKEESAAFHEARFNDKDANKDGKLTKDELKAYRDAKKAKHSSAQ